MKICDVCGGEDFRNEAGFFYCHECGTQSQHIQEVDFCEFDTTTNREANVSTVKIKSGDVANTPNLKKGFTSWEDYNFILVGYVNTLINLGANEKLKLTALQLWSAYLRKCQVAFFDEKNYALPKLGVFYRKKDSNIIYNQPIKKRFSKSKSNLPNISKRKIKKKAEKDFMLDEYMSFRETYESDGELSMSSHQTTNSGVDKIIPIEYSVIARKILKNYMHKSHIKKHEKDTKCKLDCHKFRKDNIKKICRLDVISKKTIVTLLYLALNIIQDDIQLSDLFRFFREGHIPYDYKNLSHFFPDSKQDLHKLIPQNDGNFHSHLEIRKFAVRLCKFIKVKRLGKANILNLCERYICELSLPHDLIIYIKRLILEVPPVMNYDEDANIEVPNYEGRAMAYILFFLKLIFGLDGHKEIIISKSAKILNNFLKFTPTGFETIFVWTDWVKYIEMRKIILKNCHFPTNALIETQLEQNTDLYIDYLNKSKNDDDCNQKKLFAEINTVKTFLNELESYQYMNKNLHNIENNRSIQFEHSLTPFSSYINKLIDETPEHIHIPKFMKENFSESFLEYFMNPEILEIICKNNNINVKIHICKIGLNEKTVKYVNISRNIEDYLKKQEKLKSQYYKCTFENDDENIHIEKDDENIDNENTINFSNSNETLLETSKLRDNFKNKQNVEIEPNSFRKISSKNENLTIKTESINNNNKNLNDLKTFKFDVPNFDYWIHMVNMFHLSQEQFKEIENQLPKSFTWLLKECARTIEMDNRELYHQLLILENYINYVWIKPTKLELMAMHFENEAEVKIFKSNVKSLSKYW